VPLPVMDDIDPWAASGPWYQWFVVPVVRGTSGSWYQWFVVPVVRGTSGSWLRVVPGQLTVHLASTGSSAG
jgi:antibiotic biosynthesis monooxygenase (ABM) superfamily enzyme